VDPSEGKPFGHRQGWLVCGEGLKCSVLTLPTLPPPLPTPPRHEKVQENCIDLVGRIADRGAEFVPAREWMRICFELLDMLKVGWRTGITVRLALAVVHGRSVLGEVV
jgi:splicing factor 3B subunit 1